MKKVLYGEELRNIMINSVNMICDAVGSTLGPTGNNVLINSSDEQPFITNDGITIARNIESDNICENTILEIVKEASLKTDELVGDGTTTTLVLLKSLFNNGIEQIKKGKNPIVLKKELLDCLNDIIDIITRLKRIPNKNDLLSIATISSNDKNIGEIVSEVYYKMKNKNSIKIEEGYSYDTYYEIKEGYSIELDNISSMYFKNNENIELNDVYILVLKGYLSSLEQISEIINECINNDKNIIILVEEIDDSIKQQLLSLYLHNNKNFFAFKLPEYGLHREQLEKDIAYLSECKIINIDYNNVEIGDIGYCKKIILKNDELILESDKNLDYRITELKRKLKTIHEDYEKEFINNRISKLENGIATIYVGGNTKTEIREKMMRYEDALNALEVSSNGIIPGGGITLLRISRDIKNSIFKEALLEPIKRISLNSGVQYNDIIDNIDKNKYEKLYNFKMNKYEDINETEVIDPVQVVVAALINSTSIAALLLTTNYLVINEKFESNNTL